MKSSTKDQVKGKARKIKGEIKETAGQLLDNPEMEAEGKAEKVVGKIQEKTGQVKKVFGK
ncbi:MAG: CsbD family protein [Candidatus Methanoperedens sp.]|nr:CsbD family protein [Candidatus Methanoperedens sp.]